MKVMIARIVSSIISTRLTKEHAKKKEKRVFKKARKKKELSGVDAAPIRNFPEVLADIEKKSLDF